MIVMIARIVRIVMIARIVARPTRTILFLISGTRKPLMFPKPFVRPYRVPDLGRGLLGDSCDSVRGMVDILAREARLEWLEWPERIG